MLRIKELVPGRLRPVAKRAYDYARVQYDRHVHEHPSPSYRRRIAAQATLPGFRDYAEMLCQDGYVVVPGFFGGERLDCIRQEFERLIQTNPFNPEAAVDHRIHISGTRIRESALFSELAFEPNILALVQYYWGKPVVLHGTGGTRSEPAVVEDRGSNQWHHDGKHKQIRVFILLTEVPENGQGTGYIPGSHRSFRRDIVNTRFSEETVLRYGTPVRCTGPAGSIAMIDTNGFHRATRTLGPRRDVWKYSYRAPNPSSTRLNPVPELHPDVAKALTEEQRRIARIA